MYSPWRHLRRSQPAGPWAEQNALEILEHAARLFACRANHLKVSSNVSCHGLRRGPAAIPVSGPRRCSCRLEFPVAWNRGTVTHMSEKVVPFPIPPSQRVRFLIGGRTYFLHIRAPARPKPKRAEVIPISITVSHAGEATGADTK
jgi:hypothetical protein